MMLNIKGKNLTITRWSSGRGEIRAVGLPAGMQERRSCVSRVKADERDRPILANKRPKGNGTTCMYGILIKVTDDNSEDLAGIKKNTCIYPFGRQPRQECRSLPPLLYSYIYLYHTYIRTSSLLTERSQRLLDLFINDKLGSYV